MIPVNILLTILLLVSAYSAFVYAAAAAADPPPLTPPTNKTTTKITINVTTLVINKHIVTCQNSVMTIACDAGSVINVVNANYGRKSKTVCPTENSSTTDCVSPTSVDIVRAKCNKQQNCSITASDNVFGDPCAKTSKYLEVEYQCVPATTSVSTSPPPTPEPVTSAPTTPEPTTPSPTTPEPITSAPTPKPAPALKQQVTCQYSTMTIKCDEGFVIDVIGANYGRFSKTICKDAQMLSTSCASTTSFGIVSTKCNNQQTCTIPVNNDVFGNPCSGTVKYLDVQYHCVAKPSVKNVVACEGSNLDIKCETGEEVTVHRANYGRTSSSICPNAQISNTTCSSPNSKTIVNNLCSGKQSCTIPATNAAFQDPCVDTFKYLEIDYECLPTQPPPKQIITCQYSTLDIKCAAGSVIDVKRVSYGRKTKTICEAFEMATTDCEAPKSFDIVSAKCNKKQSCSVPATNDIFGNPCSGTIKYLDVEYQCVPSK